MIGLIMRKYGINFFSFLNHQRNQTRDSSIIPIICQLACPSKREKMKTSQAILQLTAVNYPDRQTVQFKCCFFKTKMNKQGNRYKVRMYRCTGVSFSAVQTGTFFFSATIINPNETCLLPIHCALKMTIIYFIPYLFHFSNAKRK